VPLALRVLPHYWQQAWFVALCAGVLTGALAWGARHFSIRRLRARLALLGQQQALGRERQRIAQDMHDDLGSRLAQMAMLSERLQKELPEPQPSSPTAAPDDSSPLAPASLPAQPNGYSINLLADKISRTARESLRALAEIVWAVQPQNDTLEHLANFLQQHAEQFFRSSAVRCRVDMPAVHLNYPLSSAARHHLTMAVKEVLSNVVRHAQAAEVWLRLEVAENQIVIRIEDNGRGFTESTGTTRGNGLKNIRARLESLRGRLELNSAAGHGTRVTLVAPLAARARAGDPADRHNGPAGSDGAPAGQQRARD
jgi:signal transduction histidine kinase